MYNVNMKKLKIYTDGACSGNPGAGGWGAVLIYGGAQKEISGFEAQTTNNRMELTAAIEALSLVKEACEIELYSDSAYLCNAFNNNWVEKWQKSNWIGSNKELVKNKDLWLKLVEFNKKHKITFIKVKGHADNELNNRCDELATGEIKKHI